MSPDSLVLFDELGAGTDPIEGAALAQSILEKVLDVKCLCAATTHYAELKAFALNTEGVSNACCEFDVNTLKPTYKLIIGAPGKSNAFLISSKLGVSEEIVKRASELTSDDSKSFENVIGKLEESRIALEKEKEEARKLREEYEAFKLKAEKELKDKLSRAEKDAEDMVKKAQQMISGAKVSTEYIFDRLDKLQKEKDSKDFGKMYADAKKDLRNRLNEADDIYNPIEKIDDDYVLPRPLVKGDTVILKNLGTEGVLLDDPDKQGNVNVKSGIAKTKTNISNLILVTEKKTDKKKDKPESRTRAVVSKDFSISIDVRGKNVEEAWIDIDKYFDEALYSGIKSVTVVHGKGTGLLRKGLWEFFRKDQRVKKYRHGEFGEGDFGVTIVEFK
jgi:DNA mismatch repair protein MutS2